MKKFSFKTVKNFDNHISSSIKGYKLLDDIIGNISNFFMKDGENIIDIGCTSGRLLAKISNNKNCKYYGYDINDSNFIENENITLYKQDITYKEWFPIKSNLIIMVFTLQFIPFLHRLNILKKVYNSLNTGGGFIFCEKEIAVNGSIQEIFTFSNYDYKRNNFTSDEIMEKEKSLRTIMNSLQSGENRKLLNKAGFHIIEKFFQSGNFKGYLCIK